MYCKDCKWSKEHLSGNGYCITSSAGHCHHPAFGVDLVSGKVTDFDAPPCEGVRSGEYNEIKQSNGVCTQFDVRALLQRFLGYSSEAKSTDTMTLCKDCKWVKRGYCTNSKLSDESVYDGSRSSIWCYDVRKGKTALQQLGKVCEGFQGK